MLPVCHGISLIYCLWSLGFEDAPAPVCARQTPMLVWFEIPLKLQILLPYIQAYRHNTYTNLLLRGRTNEHVVVAATLSWCLTMLWGHAAPLGLRGLCKARCWALSICPWQRPSWASEKYHGSWVYPQAVSSSQLMKPTKLKWRAVRGKSSCFRELNEKLLEVRVTLIPGNTGRDLEVAGNFLQPPLSKTFKHVLT